MLTIARFVATLSGLLRATDYDGELAGMIASFTVDADRELTYWIDPSRWGLGIASGAVRLFLAVETQRPLYARVAAANQGSRRVLEKSGFKKLYREVSYAPGLGAETPEFVLRLD